MGEERDRKGEIPKTKIADDRHARLEQALRSNLLKRKAKAKVRQAPKTPSEEGGQS